MVRRTDMLAQSSLIIFNVALILTCSLIHAMKEM
jgi:hypothetical protein